MNPPERIGSHRIERLLGIGSFATVWLGHDPALDARVAIKVLAENWSHDLRVRERFLEEGRLLRRLDHDRLVRVHAVGELPDGRPYLVMTWADGGSLRDLLAHGPVPVDQGVRLLREIAAGVAVLHRQGIVHRDLTPGNVLFRSADDTSSPSRSVSDRSSSPPRVLIADLGLAKRLAVASGLTVRAGTPGYMAPEQDDPLAIVDARADVFALGRLGMTLLATPQLRPHVPPAVADVLRTATATDPDARFVDASAFADALAQAITAGDRPRQPEVAAAPDRRRRWLRTRPSRRSVLIIVGGITIAVAAAGAVVWRPDPPSGVVSDATGRISVDLPEGWRAGGAGWLGQRGENGELEPALVISPDPDRWSTDPSLPGAFIGLSRTLATRHTPTGYVASRPHADCLPAPVRTIRPAGIDWVVAAYAACGGGRPAIVEAAGLAPANGGLLYVQVTPPAGSPAGFVDGLLARIGVRG